MSLRVEMVCLGTLTHSGFASSSGREGSQPGVLAHRLPVDTEAQRDFTCVPLTCNKVNLLQTWRNVVDRQKLGVIALGYDELLEPRKRTTRVPMGTWTKGAGELYKRSRDKRSKHSYLCGRR